MNREDQPETRNKIFGPKHLCAFHWNSTKNHPTPSSYATDHSVSVDIHGNGDGQQQQYMTSLQIAFYLIRRGAGPQRVDLEVRKKILAEHQRRATADDAMSPSRLKKKQSSTTFCRDHMAGMTAQQFCEHAKDLAYTPMMLERIRMILIYLVAHNTDVLPAGWAWFIQKSATNKTTEFSAMQMVLHDGQ